MNVQYKQGFGGHLAFHDGRYRYKVENVSNEFIDLKTV